MKYNAQNLYEEMPNDIRIFNISLLTRDGCASSACCLYWVGANFISSLSVCKQRMQVILIRDADNLAVIKKNYKQFIWY